MQRINTGLLEMYGLFAGVISKAQRGNTCGFSKKPDKVGRFQIAKPIRNFFHGMVRIKEHTFSFKNDFLLYPVAHRITCCIFNHLIKIGCRDVKCGGIFPGAFHFPKTQQQQAPELPGDQLRSQHNRDSGIKITSAGCYK